ncbi:MAG TPA: phage holin family protein [Streptosporangiaceae bacterium]|nr:phage holin family protein [Streptosporangiaceae bacterium]
MSSSVDGVPDGPGGRPSIGELLSDVGQDITTLLRQEVELAKAEVRQSVTRAGKGAGMFAGAGLAGYMVLLFVSVAGWWGLGDALGRGWAALVVAGVWLIIGAALALMGRTEMKSVTGLPQTADTIKKIPDAAKGNEETA